MKLTTVIGSTNNNPHYYMFIPKQILFWKKFNINFIAIFVGDSLPTELEGSKDNIILWDKNKEINSVFTGQNIRIFYPALLNLPDDEMVMITDMDMLPMNNKYYTSGLSEFKKDDFIYYRHLDKDQIYMCYNAAHPSVWANVFNIKSEKDIEDAIKTNFDTSYSGKPGENGWYKDQELMYSKLINYTHLKILNRPINRLEMYMYDYYLRNNIKQFIYKYDDAHFHRNYFSNKRFILDAEEQLELYN